MKQWVRAVWCWIKTGHTWQVEMSYIVAGCRRFDCMCCDCGETLTVGIPHGSTLRDRLVSSEENEREINRLRKLIVDSQPRRDPKTGKFAGKKVATNGRSKKIR
jgi:hypothetical protein